MFSSQTILNHRYQLQQPLGHTAVGHQTWLALDTQSQEQVTVKLLAFSPQMQWEELKLFEREAQILKELSHERIPKYRDYFDLDKNLGGGVPWFALVQDYIPGYSLQELLDQGKRFTQAQVKAIAIEVLEILIYLHGLNPPVLHRDLKPSNLILGEDEHIYLIDFGAVQAKGAVTGVTFTIVGTSGYAPLEQFWGRAIAASDIYALGATLIHLLTGISPADLPQKDYRIQFAHKVNLESSFIVWLEKATEIALEKRFKTAREAYIALKFGLKNFADQSRKSLVNKIYRPDNSAITLYPRNNQGENQLVILVPPRGFSSFKFLFSTLDIDSFTSFLFLITWLLSLIFFVILIIRLCFLFPLFLKIVCLLIIFYIIKAFNEQTKVICKKKSWEIEKKILGFSYRNVIIDSHLIVGIFVKKNYGNNQVTIRTNKKVYFLENGFSEQEAMWLAQELQDFQGAN